MLVETFSFSVLVVLSSKPFMEIFELLDFATHETLVVNNAKNFYPQNKLYCVPINVLR